MSEEIRIPFCDRIGKCALKDLIISLYEDDSYKYLQHCSDVEEAWESDCKYLKIKTFVEKNDNNK